MSQPDMPLTSAEICHWAAAYIEAAQSPDLCRDAHHPLWWAIERFMVGTLSSAAEPEDCWRAILEVLSKQPPESVLGLLAAGPLEDLIHLHGTRFVDRIELLARQKPAFRELLRGVWQSGDPAV